MSFRYSRYRHALADDGDKATRFVSDDDLQEAAAVADGLTVVAPPQAVDVVTVTIGASPVRVLDRAEFARIAAEHAEAEAFKLAHGGASSGNDE